MRQSRFHTLIIFIATIFIATIHVHPASAERRVALVIGNSAYKNISPLVNPGNDAKLMADVLKEQGFEVVLGLDLEYRAMKRAIRRYTAKLRSYGQETIGFIFYAGHGLQVRGTNYLIPVAAEIESEGDVDIEAVSASSLLFGVREARNRLNIIVLDACRNNPYRSLFRSSTRGLRQMNAPMGSLIAFSTSPGDVAADGVGQKNSPFTAALVKSMRVPDLTIERVFKTTRREVFDSSNKKQLPWINSSLLGEFYPAGQQGTRNGKSKKVDRSAPVRSSDAAREWRSLQNSNDAGDLEAYIVQFGVKFPYYRRKAKKLLKKLKEKKVSVGVFPISKPRAERLPYEPEVVHIPGGTFSMGCLSGKNCQKDEKPVHRVTVGSFYLSKYETMVSEYIACVKARKCRPPEWQEKGSKYNAKTGSNARYKKMGDALTGIRYPIVGVSWKNAVAFANWISGKTSQTWRLPTEAEWEYAARAGMTTPYSFGNVITKQQAHFSEKKWGNAKHTKKVGSFSANKFGLHDMHGNVWEWVHDWYGGYKKSSQTNPKGPRSGSLRVFRGGGWSSSKGKFLRSAHRGKKSSDSRYGNLGFRLVRQP